MNNNTVTIIYFVVLLGLFYVLVIFPESRRKKKYGNMLESLKVNDEILTKGGILGRVISIGDTFIIVQSGPDRVRFKLDKNGISTILNENGTKKETKKEVKKETAKSEEKAE